MDSAQFDRWTTTFGRNMSRRSVGALLAGAAGLLIAQRAGAQSGPSTCGTSGDVCTMMLGCCDGLTCVTSAINTNYGVCAPGGDGGTTVGGTSLISPFSDNIDQEIASIASDATSTSTTTTDPRAEREAKLQEKRTRKDTRRSRIETRRDEQQDNKADRRDDARLAQGPLIDATLSFKGGVGGAETLQIRNRESDSIFVSRIAPLTTPSKSTGVNKTVPVNGAFSFYSDHAAFQSNVNNSVELAWNDGPICVNPGDGFRLHVAFNSSATNRIYDFSCNGTFDQVDVPSNSRKRKNKENHRDKVKQRKQSQKSRKNKGKGR